MNINYRIIIFQIHCWLHSGIYYKCIYDYSDPTYTSFVQIMLNNLKVLKKY